VLETKQARGLCSVSVVVDNGDLLIASVRERDHFSLNHKLVFYEVILLVHFVIIVQVKIYL
jgi:hypothetical protein